MTAYFISQKRRVKMIVFAVLSVLFVVSHAVANPFVREYQLFLSGEEQGSQPEKLFLGNTYDEYLSSLEHGSKKAVFLQFITGDLGLGGARFITDERIEIPEKPVGEYRQSLKAIEKALCVVLPDSLVFHWIASEWSPKNRISSTTFGTMNSTDGTAEYRRLGSEPVEKITDDTFPSVIKPFSGYENGSIKKAYYELDTGYIYRERSVAEQGTVPALRLLLRVVYTKGEEWPQAFYLTTEEDDFLLLSARLMPESFSKSKVTYKKTQEQAKQLMLCASSLPDKLKARTLKVLTSEFHRMEVGHRSQVVDEDSGVAEDDQLRGSSATGAANKP